MTIKEYCESCKNKGSHKCHSCMGRYYDGVLQGKPTKYIKKPQTNADRIRAMSDEELAVWLEDVVSCLECPIREECNTGSQCRKWMEKWLKQPAEGE